mgnify:FL=1
MLVEEEQLTLERLLTALERGNKLRISILPLGRTAFGGRLFLTRERIIHAHLYCDRMKVTTSGLEKCLACKSLATKKAVEGKEPFCSYCIHGAWEAVVPVVRDDMVLAVVFVGGLFERPSRGYVPECGALLEHVPDASAYLETGKVIAAFILEAAKADPAVLTREKATGLAAVTDYVDAYFCSELTLKRLSRIFYINEKYLGRLFKKTTGLAFNEYINRKRLHRAAELLLNTELPILTVALDCGFNNTSYFYRLFGKEFGLAPAAYRNREKHRLVPPFTAYNKKGTKN